MQTRPGVGGPLPLPTVPQTTWERLRAFGRRWPALYRHAHLLALCLLPVELLTGACLYFPRLHSALIPVLPLILRVHDWCGAAFGVLLLLPVVMPLGRRALSSVDWRAVLWLLSGLSLTGLLLWSSAAAGVLRAGAFGLHGVLAVVLLAFIVYHGLVRLEAAARGGDPERLQERRGPLGRRAMLRHLAGGLGFSAAATVLFGVFDGELGAVLARATAPLGGAEGSGPGRDGASGTADRGGGSEGAVAAAAARPSRPLPGFQIYSVTGGIPMFDPETFRLYVNGQVRHPMAFTLDDLMQRLPQVNETRNFRCVTGWEVPKVRWRGVRIADLLRLVLPHDGAGWLTFHSFDGLYTDSLSILQATADGVLLAHHADGAPLAPEQGAPVRLIVPQMYGYKSVKWLGRIEVSSSRVLGYWEQRGYGPDAYLGTPFGWPAGETPAQFGLRF